MAYTFNDGRFETDTAKGHSHTCAHGENVVLGSFFMTPLKQGLSETVWLEHVKDTDSEHSELYWVAGYDRSGKPNRHPSETFGKKQIQDVVKRWSED